MTTRTILPMRLFLPLVVLAGCTGMKTHSNLEGPAAPEIRQTLEGRWAVFIDRWEAEDADGAAAVYAQGGVNLSPTGQIGRGREAIAEFYGFLFEQHRRSEYSHVVLSVDAIGDRDALELGEFTVDWVTNEGEEWRFEARSLTHWQRNARGEWEIATLMFQDLSDS